MANEHGHLPKADPERLDPELRRRFDVWRAKAYRDDNLFLTLARRPARVYRECTIYTTLSPCAMCSGAILLYGIPRVVVGEHRTFLGEEALLRARGVTVEVLHDARCQELMARFIQANPALWAEDIGE